MEPLVISRCNVVSGASLGHWYWGGGHTTASAGHAIPGARGIGILDDTRSRLYDDGAKFCTKMWGRATIRIDLSLLINASGVDMQ